MRYGVRLIIMGHPWLGTRAVPASPRALLVLVLVLVRPVMGARTTTRMRMRIRTRTRTIDLLAKHAGVGFLPSPEIWTRANAAPPPHARTTLVVRLSIRVRLRPLHPVPAL